MGINITHLPFQAASYLHLNFSLDGVHIFLNCLFIAYKRKNEKGSKLFTLYFRVLDTNFNRLDSFLSTVHVCGISLKALLEILAWLVYPL